jgi:hypothetical protein
LGIAGFGMERLANEDSSNHSDRAAVLFAPAAGFSQTWDGGGANDNLTAPNNWNPNGVPANDGTANLVFDGNVRTKPKVNVNFDVASVTFAATAATGFEIGQINNSTLTVRGGGITNFEKFPKTFAVPINFATDSTINAGGGGFNFNEAVGLGTNTVTVSGDGFSIRMKEITGTGELIVNASSIMSVDSAAPAAGYDLTVNDGLFIFERPMTFGFVSAIEVNGGTFEAKSGMVLDGGRLDVDPAASFGVRETLEVRNGGRCADRGSVRQCRGFDVSGDRYGPAGHPLAGDHRRGHDRAGRACRARRRRSTS